MVMIMVACDENLLNASHQSGNATLNISKYRSNVYIAVRMYGINECGVISDHFMEETIRTGPGIVIILISIISICTSNMNSIMLLDTASVASSPCTLYMYQCWWCSILVMRKGRILVGHAVRYKTGHMPAKTVSLSIVHHFHFIVKWSPIFVF